MFEATHGSAPKYKGQNKVNPTALMLSGVLMLRHLGERDAADRLEARDRLGDQEGREGHLRPQADPRRPVGRRHLAVRRRRDRGDERMSQPVKVTVTGAAGQIGYALLFRIASGQLLGARPAGAPEPARDPAGGQGGRGHGAGAVRLRVPAARRDRHPRRRRGRRSTARTSRCSSAPARARRAWSAPTCSRPTARSSSRRARRSPPAPPTTSGCSWSATRPTRTR